MKLQYAEVAIVLKDRANIVHRRVPVWEVPILEALHGDVSVVKEIVEERPTPSSDAEFDRLSAAYGESVGENGDKGLPFVAAVYGQHGAGRSALRAAMQAAVLPAETEVTPPEQLVLNKALAASLLAEIASGANVAADLIG